MGANFWGGVPVGVRLRPPEKKYLTCLGCGREMWTDAAHRFCSKCRRRNKDVFDPPRHRASTEDIRAASEA